MSQPSEPGVTSTNSQADLEQWRYRSMLEAQTELVCRHLPDTTIVYVNNAFCHYFGLDKQNLIGKSYTPIVYEADQVEVARQLNSLSCDHPRVTTQPRVLVNGEVRWTEWNNHCFYDEQGQVVECQSVGRDITHLKEAEANQQRINDLLEQRIADRTAELVAVNQALRQEIQDRQQVEVDLKSSEARFRRAIVDAPFPIFIHAEDGEILQVSQAVSEITGYLPDELRTLSDWTERAYGDRQRDIMMGINRLYTLGRRSNEGGFEIRTKNGATRTWLFSSAPLGQLANGTRLMISMAADITELEQTKQALAIRIRQQLTVAQLSQTALSGLDLTALFDQATQLVAESLQVPYCKVLELLPDGQALRLRSGVGWQPGLIGQVTVDAEHESQSGYTLISQHPVIVDDLQTETRFRVSLLLKQHFVMSGISTVIQGANDRPFGVLGAYSREYRAFTEDDINFLQAVANILATAIQRKQAEQVLQHLNQTLEQRIQNRTQQLEESNRELEAFSYSVAHDLRAPLRAIQGLGQVLVEDYSSRLDDLGKEYIQQMSLSAEHLDLLIEDLLTYGQLGRTEIHLHQVSIDTVLEEIFADLESELQTKQAKVEIEPNLPSVYAQRTVLKQILSNLIENALKFVSAGVQPQIRIWAEQREVDHSTHAQWIRLWVEDNGLGIDPKHQPRIFKAFERLHGVESYAGTGIGLAIVERGVKRLGGRVGVQSSLNQGSRFWIELPTI